MHYDTKQGKGKGNGQGGSGLGKYDKDTLDDHSQWSKSEGESELMKQIADQVVKSAIEKNINDINK